MAEAKTLKNHKCYKHKIPIIRYAPINDVGNAYGERWYCPECEGECEKIIATP